MDAKEFLANEGYTHEEEAKGWILTTDELIDLLNRFQALSKSGVSDSLPLLDKYREYILRTGLSDRKTLQDWIKKQ